MARRAEPVSLIKRPKTKYWYYKLGDWKTYKSSGETVKAEALKVALAALKEAGAGPTGPTFRRYAGPFFVWESCPHVRRLASEGKSVTRYHVKNMRSVLEHHVLTDPIAKLRITEIKRANILDFREEINRDPTAGVGVTKYQAAEIGAFTAEELRALFPAKLPGPWKDLAGYAGFLTAATTGMRRGEILALTWECLNSDVGSLEVRQAWKDRHELGPSKWKKHRTVPMPSLLAETLKRLRRRKRHIETENLVFSYPDGSRFGGTWWTKQDFEEAILLFSKRQFPGASELFRKVVTRNPEDHGAAIFLDRCSYFQNREKANWLLK